MRLPFLDPLCSVCTRIGEVDDLTHDAPQLPAVSVVKVMGALAHVVFLGHLPGSRVPHAVPFAAANCLVVPTSPASYSMKFLLLPLRMKSWMHHRHCPELLARMGSPVA